MTVHNAKGLEFPVVFVCGMAEEIMSSKKKDLKEERRICFLGISRAKKILFFSYSILIVKIYSFSELLGEVFILPFTGSCTFFNLFDHFWNEKEDFLCHLNYYIFLNGYRGEKTPSESTTDLAQAEVESLYPTILMPVSIAVFDLVGFNLFFEQEEVLRISNK